jgi:hypothetical protein
MTTVRQTRDLAELLITVWRNGSRATSEYLHRDETRDRLVVTEVLTVPPCASLRIPEYL